MSFLNSIDTKESLRLFLLHSRAFARMAESSFSNSTGVDRAVLAALRQDIL